MILTLFIFMDISSGLITREDCAGRFPYLGSLCHGVAFTSCSFGVYTDLHYDASKGRKQYLPIIKNDNCLEVHGIIIDIIG